MSHKALALIIFVGPFLASLVAQHKVKQSNDPTNAYIRLLEHHLARVESAGSLAEARDQVRGVQALLRDWTWTDEPAEGFFPPSGASHSVPPTNSYQRPTSYERPFLAPPPVGFGRALHRSQTNSITCLKKYSSVPITIAA